MSDTAKAVVDSDRDEDAYLSPPVQRAVRLLRHIVEGDPVTNLSRSARELGINRTTLLRLLHTLHAERFLEPRGEAQGWRIGTGLIALAAQAFYSEDLVQTAVPVLTRLADQLMLSTHLGVLDGLEVVFVVRRTPNHSVVSNIRIGSRLPAHAANMGRIILAHMPADKVDRMYAGTELKPVTAHTVVTLAQMHAQLAADRAAGLAWSDGNYEAGISSVAAAIFDPTGEPVAAINVSGHSADFSGAARRAEIAAGISVAAREISERLGWLAPDRADGTATKPLAQARHAQNRG
ncbi:MAG TPA: IclR family transcriptional regulator [Pseudolabrys sp.]|nr:IclR family transcriptional regulator [Pseudolabrys sp.]